MSDSFLFMEVDMGMKYIAAIALALVLSSPSFGGTSKTAFVKQAIEAGEFEIVAGRLALLKGETLRVKVFAQKMILDHTAAAQKLEKAAAKAGIPRATESIKITQAHLQDMETLHGAEAGRFDPIYVEVQRKALESAVKLYSEYAESGDDPHLKQFAAETLPTLQSHLDDVKTLKVT